TICNKIVKNPSKDILLISPPQSIIHALRQYCVDNSIELKSLDSIITDYLLSIKKEVVHFQEIVKFILKNWIKIIMVRGLLKNRLQGDYKKEKLYVLRTWVYESSIGRDNKYSDSFFGRLPEFLIGKGERVVILAGIVNNYGRVLKKLSKCEENYPIIPQEYFLRMSDVVKVALEVYFNRINLREKIELYDLDVTTIIQDELDTNYRETLYIRTELLQRYIIKNMLAQCSIHTFTTTYENNPWEKICILSLSEYSSSTKIMGYQHAVISRASANMYVSKDEMPFIPMPDKVLTTGDITKSMLEKYGSYPKNSIKSSCALRHEYIYKLKRKDFTRSCKILVALEGVYECYKLVNFVFNALSGTNDFQVIIRTHPARPFNKIKNDLCFDIDSHTNFSVSTQKTLKEDLSEVDILIYWGSTVAMEALMMGIPVIHVSLDDIVAVDPLFDCRHLKWTVKNREELQEVISQIYNLPEQNYLDQYDEAKSYIEKYLKKVTDNRLYEFIA
ncbi:MAG: hypothetical protein NUV86_08720, partial [Candidatus Scalindua sp.]|nr:hypothetical protein [Candidatus Scalindua sp.]MCR4344850.1 hypothetical protein [Candidatus Scalindua sp.]